MNNLHFNEILDKDGEAVWNNFVVFGLTRPELKPMIYSTRGEHANHYTTDAVLYFDLLCLTSFLAIFQLYHGDQF